MLPQESGRKCALRSRADQRLEFCRQPVPPEKANSTRRSHTNFQLRAGSQVALEDWRERADLASLPWRKHSVPPRSTLLRERQSVPCRWELTRYEKPAASLGLL